MASRAHRSPATPRPVSSVSGVIERITDVQREIIDFYRTNGKPLLRGWIHAGFAPLAFIAGIVLIVLSGGGPVGVACAIFSLTGVLLFGISGIYHRGYWPARARMILKRLDHANITLLIAGTYTPIALTLLEGSRQVILLWSIWGCALSVTLFRVFWTSSPRWLYTPIYVVMGLLAVFYLGDFWQVSPTATVLITTGGATYIAGAVFYGTKRPDIAPHVFGFHELFHVFTVLGFIQHYIAVVVALFV
ncbi:PAQR family membrane homeostasis protein TrhA [Rothia nasisuis]|uniref:PAQR family membrane homeostasis protein TrhA n=1 Tax=Rothia nasisuis TaxID=2109647 RepID=UPI001F008C00|nr:hemolysin III family protein [Rothia nasisuis]